MIDLPSVPVRMEYVPFQGGLDVESTALSVAAGALLACSNYDPDALGGYRRIGGYERFDGRPRPSDAVVIAVACTLGTVPAPGATLTIGAVTCIFVRTIPGGMLACNATGPIPAGSPIVAASVVIGTTATPALMAVATMPQQEAQNSADSANVLRAFIGAVPGSGPVRGVHIYRGDVFAFRDNATATAGVMFRATPTGWATVALGEVVAFTNATALLADGGTLTQGGVTATVARMVVETGTIQSGVNTGRVFIRGRAGGSFAAGAAGPVTLAGAQSAVTLPAGGRYEFENHAFTGAENALRMYGVNGVGPAFEFDGQTLVTIRTNNVPDRPVFVRANRGFLFLAQGASVVNSSAGNPYRFVAAEGASEIATGDTVTGMAVLAGEALGIFGRNRSQALTGAAPTNWVLQTIRSDVGAVPYTVQSMSDTYMLADRGIVSVATTNRYGNFADATLSRKVQRLIDAARSRVVAAYVNRQAGHYKLITTDGATITMSVNNDRLGGFTAGQYGFAPFCVATGSDAAARERTFAGAADGFVYELNRGSSFDGAPIEAFIRVFYINSRSPEVRKRYRRVTMEMSAQLYGAIQFQAEFSYGDPEVQATPGNIVEAGGPGGVWGFANWDEFIWDGQEITRPSFSVSGTGINMAMTFYSNSALDAGHVLSGAIVHYTPRKLQRT